MDVGFLPTQTGKESRDKVAILSKAVIWIILIGGPYPWDSSKETWTMNRELLLLDCASEK